MTPGPQDEPRADGYPELDRLRTRAEQWAAVARDADAMSRQVGRAANAMAERLRAGKGDVGERSERR